MTTMSTSWIIEDMEEKMKSFPPGRGFKTDIFSVGESKWSCKIWPNGQKEEYKNHISFAIFAESEERFTANYECSVGKGDSGHTQSLKKEFNRLAGIPNWCFYKFLPHEIVQEKKKQLMSRGRMEFTIIICLDEEGQQDSLMEETSEINVLRELSENAGEDHIQIVEESNAGEDDIQIVEETNAGQSSSSQTLLDLSVNMDLEHGENILVFEKRRETLREKPVLSYNEKFTCDYECVFSTKVLATMTNHIKRRHGATSCYYIKNL